MEAVLRQKTKLFSEGVKFDLATTLIHVTETIVPTVQPKKTFKYTQLQEKEYILLKGKSRTQYWVQA